MWLWVIAAIGLAFYLNAGRIVRMYFMGDGELRRVHDKVIGYVRSEVPVADRLLVIAIIAIESAGNVSARSPAGAVGLMQITEPALEDYRRATGTAITLPELTTLPQFNVRVGYWYLRSLETAHGLTRFDALRAYNAGIGSVRRDAENEVGANYAVKVLAYQSRLKEVV